MKQVVIRLLRFSFFQDIVATTYNFYKCDAHSLKKWFRNSIVTNSRGEPLTVYHGTKDGDLTSFCKDKTTWFTTSRKYSEKYSTRSGVFERLMLFVSKSYMFSSKKVIPCYIRLENPLEIGATHNGWWHQEYDKHIFLNKTMLNQDEVESIANKIKPYRIYELTASNEFRNYIKTKGYDGIVGEEYSSKVFAVFEPAQIKFARAPVFQRKLKEVFHVSCR